MRPHLPPNGRRNFLMKLGMATLSYASGTVFQTGGNDEALILSDQGCGRATGYAEANKIVTAGGKTFFCWLESKDDQFRVCIRALHQRDQSLSETVHLGNAHDNHGGPALTIDRTGFLHIVYFPHHHAMRYRRSARPYDISDWETEEEFGIRSTYPTLICGPNDDLFCAVRESDDTDPWEVHLYQKSLGGSWQLLQKILRSRHTGYSHFQESLSWSPVDRKLHLLCRFHEGSGGNAYGRIQTVAYMQSSDFGKSWMKLDGTPVVVPAEVETMDVLAQGGEDYGVLLRAGGMSVDYFGIPHLVFSEQEGTSGRSFLVMPGKDLSWDFILLNDFLPSRYRSWMLTMPGGITFDDRNNMYITAQIKLMREGEKYWGHPTNEVVSLSSRDGGKTFEFKLLSSQNAEEAHWLPSIERNTGHHTVKDRPWCMYTSGPPGQNNRDILANQVLAVRL